MTDDTATASGRWLLDGTTPVHRIGFGAMRLPARGHGGPPVPRADALAVLRRAIELGVDHIDTAAFYRYGGASANELVRAALHPYPSDLVIATKVGPVFGPHGTHRDATPDDLPGLVHQNLRELGVDRLDLVYLRVGGLSAVDGPIGERFTALAALREQALIRHLGLSNVTAGQLAEARRIAPVAAVQNQYHVAARGDAALVAHCAAQHIGYVPFFPLGGMYTAPAGGRQLDSHAALDRVAARHGGTAAQAALAWLLGQSPALLPIPGTSSVEHLAENVAAGGIALTDADRAELAAELG